MTSSDESSEHPPGKPCARCRANRWLPIVHGMPGFELMEAAERGEVVLAGCSVEVDAPEWQCARCGNQVPERSSVRPNAGPTRVAPALLKRLEEELHYASDVDGDRYVIAPPGQNLAGWSVLAHRGSGTSSERARHAFSRATVWGHPGGANFLGIGEAAECWIAMVNWNEHLEALVPPEQA